MNGVDPSPEDITLEKGLFTSHVVKVFCYNQQVVDFADRRASGRPRSPPACRSSASTRRCRPRVRLPVVDGGRGGCHPGGGGARHLDGAPVSDTPVLRVDGVGVSFGRPPGPRRRLLRDPPGRVHRAHRIQRSGQDDAAAGHPRHATSRRRHGPIRSIPGRPALPITRLRAPEGRARSRRADAGTGPGGPRPRRQPVRVRTADEGATLAVDQILHDVDADDFADSRVGTLSGESSSGS